MESYPNSFIEIIAPFQSFLKSNNWPIDLIWVTKYKRINLFNISNWIYAKSISEYELETEYLFGKGNFGAAANALGVYKNRTIANLKVPKTDLDAQNNFIGNLNMKYSLNVPKINFSFIIIN
jgi:hypothetical protein